MNMKRKANRPKLAIAGKELMTVLSKSRREVQDLTILKILKSLKPLKTVKVPPTEGSTANSAKEIMTMIPSKMLNPSLTYPLTPSPSSLSTISTANKTVKMLLAIFWTSKSQSGC